MADISQQSLAIRVTSGYNLICLPVVAGGPWKEFLFNKHKKMIRLYMPSFCLGTIIVISNI